MPVFGAPNIDKLGESEDIPGLIKALDYKKDGAVRAAAAETLMKVGYTDMRCVEPLIAVLGDPDWRVRRAAAVTLGSKRARSAAWPLSALLRDPESEVREAAASALGFIHDIGSLSPLIAVLDDEAAAVRAVAAWSLGFIRDPRATEALVGALEDKSVEVRQAVAKSLRLHGRQADAARAETRPIATPPTSPTPPHEDR